MLYFKFQSNEIERSATPDMYSVMHTVLQAYLKCGFVACTWCFILIIIMHTVFCFNQPSQTRQLYSINRNNYFNL